MKKLVILLLVCLTFGQVFAQTDHNEHLVYKSVLISEKSMDNNCLLSSSYYTLRNNIENKKSSAFISENPTLDQIEHAAINFDSNVFVLTKDSKSVVVIVLQNDPRRRFRVLAMERLKLKLYPCKLEGDITENRAKEIIEANYDPMATIENGTLKFNGKEFVIIPSQAIEDAVMKLIKTKKLTKKKPSLIMIY